MQYDDFDDAALVAALMMMMMTCTGYYHCLRCLTESRLPSCVEQNDSGAPPSAFADTVLMLVTRPLTLDADSNSSFSYVCVCLMLTAHVTVSL